MPLPAGFRVNGSKTSASNGLVPPRVKKIIALLDKLPFGDLLGSRDVAMRVATCSSGDWISHPALENYRERVDRKFYWGSPKSIAKLRAQLANPEEPDAEN